MLYYRLYEKVETRKPLGYGVSGARWNKKGTTMICASNTISLNFMELLSILGSSVAKCKWVLATYEINSAIPHLDKNDLPKDWHARPHPRTTQAFGTHWAQSQTTPFLKVPSCSVPLVAYPKEHNLLINPLHPDCHQFLEVASTEEVSFELNDWEH